MKIIVFSDSHGNMDWMIAAMEQERPDCVFFLGDHQKDGWALSDLYPRILTYVVRGNCDWGPGTEETLLELEGVRFLLTHGHQYGAKTGMGGLRSAGLRAGADMVCFGHTHHAVSLEEGTVRLFNPGTIGGPYGQRRTYGLLTVKDGAVTAEIKDTDTM